MGVPDHGRPRLSRTGFSERLVTWFGALAAGLGFGFVVAAQVGPIWLLCVRSVLRGRFPIGVAIGAGAAAIDVTYAALGVAGAAGILKAFPQLRLALGLLGAAILVIIGARTSWSALRIRHGMESTEEVGSPRRALVTALVATASNPLTIASWAAVFTASSAAHLTRGLLAPSRFCWVSASGHWPGSSCSLLLRAWFAGSWVLELSVGSKPLPASG